MMKAFLGRLKTEFSKLMLVCLSLIFIFPSGNRVDAGCNLPNFQCQSGISISGCFQCDHEPDCPEGSDEKGCAQVNKSMALLWSSKDSSTKLGNLGLLYGDLDVCLEQLQREQTFNTSYYRTSNQMSDLTLSFDSVEVDYVKANVIFFDQAQKSIDIGPYFIGGISGIILHLFLPPVSNQVTGLSFDWSSKLLYLSDAGYQRIAVYDASNYIPTWWRPVVDTNLTSPQDVVVYPNQSYLFWIDLDISPKIERFDLVNEIREVLVSNNTISRPTKLAIDFISERLYWLDSNKETIGSCNLDGSDVSLWQLSLFSQISAFAFYRQYLFLGDRTRSLIHAFNASRHQVLRDFELFTSQQGIIDLATYDPSKQMDIISLCTVSKGGCSHFCIRIDATARKCQCAMGFFLDLDGISCVTRPFRDNFLLVSDTQQRQLFQVDIATGEVRATIDAGSFSPTAADYDDVSTSVFWFDSYNKTIRQSNLDSGTNLVFVNYIATEITSLAVDTVNRNLYYTTYLTGTIGVISLSTRKNQTILANPDSAPRVVILDSDSRSMFWSDCGQRSIEKAQISDPSDHQSIVSQLDFCVSALAVDFINGIIYWGDNGGKIESSKLDGSARRLIYTNSTAIYTGMTIDDNYLYIADNTRRQLLKLDRVTNKISSLTGNLFSKPYALIRYNSASGSNKRNISTTPRPTSPSKGSEKTFTSTTPASASQGSEKTFISPTPASATQGGASTTTIILASVICGSVVLIAVIVAVGILVAKLIKRRKNAAFSGYGNVIPSSNEFRQRTYQPDNAMQDEMYTELADLPNNNYDLEIDNMGQDEGLKETTDSNRQPNVENDYI